MPRHGESTGCRAAAAGHHDRYRCRFPNTARAWSPFLS